MILLWKLVTEQTICSIYVYILECVDIRCTDFSCVVTHISANIDYVPYQVFVLTQMQNFYFTYIMFQ